MPHDLEHALMVVAPWWKWEAPTDTVDGRTTSPVLQKYDTPNLVNDFLKNPQRCLRRMDEDDVHIAQEVTSVPQDSKGRPRRFGNVDATGLRVFDDVVDDPRTLKVFLDTHKRFYLVVCEVHCDAGGFPKVKRESICEAGFVVRRRVTENANDAVVQARRRFCAARTALREIDTKLVKERALHTSARNALRVLMTERREKTLVKHRGFAEQRVAAAQTSLREAVRRFGAVVTHLQGWFGQLAPLQAKSGKVIGAAPVENVGVWCDVEEEPSAIGDESRFPLYPLIPPPAETEHAGQFGTIYFGLLPTGGRDTDPSGRPRFDDQTQYEVRCFVKRHLKPHAKGGPCPCPDATFWSLPTEPYKLASQFDLIGTSHQPVTIQLPDLAQLAAQAKPLPGVGFATPQGYPMMTADKDGNRKPLPPAGSFQICTLPIPLITIVAKFLFDIFLPVVMFAFGLFWMLKLKFCIPPEIKLDAGIGAVAKAQGGRFKVDAKVDFEATTDAGDGKMLQAKVDESITDNFPAIAADLTSTWSATALANMELDQLDTAENPPDITASLQFEAEVAHA